MNLWIGFVRIKNPFAFLYSFFRLYFGFFLNSSSSRHQLLLLLASLNAIAVFRRVAGISSKSLLNVGFVKMALILPPLWTFFDFFFFCTLRFNIRLAISTSSNEMTKLFDVAAIYEDTRTGARPQKYLILVYTFLKYLHANR